MHAARHSLGRRLYHAGEPQNLLDPGKMGWDFSTFFVNMAPVTMPVLAAGLLTCILLESTSRLGYGQNCQSQFARFCRPSTIKKQPDAASVKPCACGGGRRCGLPGVRAGVSHRGSRIDRADHHCPADCIQRHRGRTPVSVARSTKLCHSLRCSWCFSGSSVSSTTSTSSHQ